jgi:two-component system, NtrC family, sensor kinase
MPAHESSGSRRDFRCSAYVSLVTSKLSASSATAIVRIAITDNGSGIKRNDLPHVFEPFFTTRDVGQGTGLGLSIAHGIVTEHGGWMTVESVLQQGSTFTVFLPIEVEV